MKTKLSVLCILPLLFSACGEKPSPSTGTSAVEGKVLLATELPPEVIIGTPAPIVFPLHTSG